SLNLDDCQHVAVTYEGIYSDLKMYINGIEQELVSFGQSPAGYINDNSALDLIIGNSLNQNSTFDGIIDEVRIWNVARSAEEIQAGMQTDLNGDEPGLVGYWPMNEGNGSFIFDITANANNGAIDGPGWIAGCEQQNAIEDNSDGSLNLPDFFSLEQNYPNPVRLNPASSNPSTTITFSLTQPAKLKLSIYDLSGRLV
ncbi:MAG: LamG domain-containing protein, partial [Planctomycetes bacterium]|nr:LamG domain-containing protein [Planctomycetota bacterium]